MISRGNEIVGEVVCLGKQDLALSLLQGGNCRVNTCRSDPDKIDAEHWFSAVMRTSFN